MDKDSIAGAVKRARGVIKEAVGETTGDAKLPTEGPTDKAEGMIQKVLGRLKEAVRNARR